MQDLDGFLSAIDLDNTIKHKKRIVYNLPMSFDIETTSFYQSDKGVVIPNEDICRYNGKAHKKAVMYIWQFAVGNNVIYGRTWGDFMLFIDRLSLYMDLESNRYIVVYVHNLSYEFQFICRRFEWSDIFADSERKPIRAETKGHIIFKCSYRLSGYSLAVLADNLRSKSVKKMVGDLDYTFLRNSKTPLSDVELGYCVNDVLIVTQYIKEQIEDFGDIASIPLTQTGKVRRFVREKCFENEKYKFMIKKLTIEKTEYMLLKNAFAGGFTHCNAMYADNICKNVDSFDFTSSYPTVLIAEKYPMSKGFNIKVESEEELYKLCGNYSVLADIRLENVKSAFLWENIISYSKCRDIKNARINNGRIVSADSLTISVTDLDLLNFKKFYTWDKMNIGLVYIYKRDYLPREIIETILTLYKDKTELKGVDGKEVEYLHSKELLNSIYGMCVTSIVHDTVTFDGKNWSTEGNNIDDELKAYNEDDNRFLFYQWGVWCTAYARNNLYTAILECKNDYIYSDTDSVKILNAGKHKPYFDRYNKWIVGKLTACMEHYKLDTSLIRPKTIRGIEKVLGVWDFDGHYDRFKTLGAKRYITESNGKLAITVCGLSKKAGKEYIAGQEKPFDFFNDGMLVDSEHTGKMTHTYIDSEIEGVLVDYLGNEGYYNELSYIHLEKTGYLLNLTKMYIDYYRGLQQLYK